MKTTERSILSKTESSHFLPPDVLVILFSFLRAHEVVNNCARTCRDWRLLVHGCATRNHTDNGNNNHNGDDNNFDCESFERCTLLWRTLHQQRWRATKNLTRHMLNNHEDYNNNNDNNDNNNHGNMDNDQEQQEKEEDNETTVTTTITSTKSWRRQFEHQLKQLTFPCAICQEACSFEHRLFIDRPKFIRPCKCLIGYAHVQCWNHTRRYKNEQFLMLKSSSQSLPFQRCANCSSLYKMREDPQYDGKYFSAKENIARKRMNLFTVIFSVVALLIYVLLDRFTDNGALSNIGFYFSMFCVSVVWAFVMVIIIEVNTRFYNDEMVKRFYLVDFVTAPDCLSEESGLETGTSSGRSINGSKYGGGFIERFMARSGLWAVIKAAIESFYLTRVGPNRSSSDLLAKQRKLETRQRPGAKQTLDSCTQ